MDSLEESGLAHEYEGVVVSLEAGIATGKSYLCRNIFGDYTRRHNIPYYPSIEKIDPEMLKLFVPHRDIYGELMQTSCFEGTCRRLDLAWMFVECNGGLAVVDRGLEGNERFEEVNHQLGNITPEGHAWYQCRVHAAKQATKKPNMTVYLDTSAEILRKRIAKRGEDAEKGYPLSYLRQLEQSHLLWSAQTVINDPTSIGIIAYDKFPPADSTTDIIAAFLRAKRLEYEFPKLYTQAPGGPTMDDPVRDILKARAEWKKADVLQRWVSSPNVDSVVSLLGREVNNDFWRRVMYHLMMCRHVYAPQLRDLLA